MAPFSETVTYLQAGKTCRALSTQNVECYAVPAIEIRIIIDQPQSSLAQSLPFAICELRTLGKLIGHVHRVGRGCIGQRVHVLNEEGVTIEELGGRQDSKTNHAIATISCLIRDGQAAWMQDVNTSVRDRDDAVQVLKSFREPQRCVPTTLPSPCTASSAADASSC